MRLDITYTLTLTETEAQILKRLLGGMSDKDFERFGIKEQDIGTMQEMWEAIPYGEDE